MTTESMILIIDDEDEIRHFLKTHLANLGFATVEAADGHDALEKLEAMSFDAILCDLTMPKLTGLELLSEIRKLQLDIPLVFLTGNGTMASAVEALRLGALDFLEKPFDLQRLTNVITRAVEIGKRRRKLNARIAQAFSEDEYKSIQNEKRMIAFLELNNNYQQKKV